MRPDHKEAFFRVANDVSCWIGLREPNPLTDKWIGRAQHTPKADTSAVRRDAC